MTAVYTVKEANTEFVHTSGQLMGARFAARHHSKTTSNDVYVYEQDGDANASMVACYRNGHNLFDGDPPVSGGSPELDEPRLPDAKTMQEITAAVQRKVGTNPTREQVAAALDAVMAERLQDILTLAQVIADNKETAARFMAEQFQPTIHLQGIGSVRAKPADELRVGDTTLWNYGAKEIIQSIEQTSKAFITVYVLPPYADRYATPQPRRLKRSRLVGIAA